MTELEATSTPPARRLAALLVPLLLVAIVLGTLFGMGYLEMGLVLALLLPFALPALSFYVWAWWRGDLD